MYPDSGDPQHLPPKVDAEIQTGRNKVKEILAILSRGPQAFLLSRDETLFNSPTGTHCYAHSWRTISDIR